MTFEQKVAEALVLLESRIDRLTDHVNRELGVSDDQFSIIEKISSIVSRLDSLEQWEQWRKNIQR